MEMRYVSTDNTGWLRVKLEPGGMIVALPQYIKAAFTERRNGRDYFSIEEGRGKTDYTNRFAGGNH